MPIKRIHFLPCDDTVKGKLLTSLDSCWTSREKDVVVILQHLGETSIKPSDRLQLKYQDRSITYAVVSVDPLTETQTDSTTVAYFQGAALKPLQRVEFLVSPQITTSSNVTEEGSLPERIALGLWRSLTLQFQSEEVDSIQTAETAEVDLHKLSTRLESRVKKSPMVVYRGKWISAMQINLLVKTLDEDVGLVTAATEISCVMDPYKQFNRVYISPFQDTIPATYSVDLFDDYLRPYLMQHSLARFGEEDSFIVQGVQFKVLVTEPSSSRPVPLASRVDLLSPLSLMTELLESDEALPPIESHKGRIGPNTSIFLGKPILPHWLDVLPPHQQELVRGLPRHMQAFAVLRMISEAHPSDIDRVMNSLDSLGGAATSTDEQVDCERYIETDGGGDDFYCAVCLSGTVPAEDRSVKLPCGHRFHLKCVTHWFRRSFVCPLCKSPFPKNDPHHHHH